MSSLTKDQRAFAIAALRRASYRWKPRNEAKLASRTSRKLGSKGRTCWFHQCAMCLGEFESKGIRMDHIQPVVSVNNGFTTLDAWVSRLLSDLSNWQALCVPCHKAKTKAESTRRKANRKKPC